MELNYSVRVENNMNMVSLILTTYNSSENLPKTLASIEEQSYPDIEVIIKDGASDDGTVDIIRKYAAESHNKVKWVSQKDHGIYDAMNQGYGISSGELIVFFNDVFSESTVVSEMVKIIETTPACIGAHADLVYVIKERTIRKWKMGPQKNISSGWMPGHPTLFLKREIYEKYGLYHTEYQVAADYEFMIRFLKDGNNRLAYLPKVIIKMYYGGISTSGIGGYMTSLREGHKALRNNDIKNAVFIDLLRTFRVIMQFFRR